MGWLRALGRRFGIGERRWMPDAQERDVHRRDVRRRLLDDAGVHDDPLLADRAQEAEVPGDPDGSRMTDGAPEPEGGEGSSR